MILLRLLYVAKRDMLKGGYQAMMYPYITLYDETLITHSQILDNGEVKSVEVHFERPVECGFDSARCVLPSYDMKSR